MWHSWLHHSRFSGVTPEDALQKMNASIAEANAFFKTSWKSYQTLVESIPVKLFKEPKNAQ